MIQEVRWVRMIPNPTLRTPNKRCEMILDNKLIMSNSERTVSF